MVKDNKQYQEENSNNNLFYSHNTQFSHNATELKLRIYKKNRSSTYNMAVAKENWIPRIS